MSGHLPECIAWHQPPEVDIWGPFAPCICGRLRACEQRVREDLSLVRVSVEDDPKELERIATFEFQRTADVRADERAKTLDAAREAVAACVAEPSAPEGFIYISDAFAAIDALREETK